MAEPVVCKGCERSIGDREKRYQLRHGGVVCEACRYERRSASASYSVRPADSELGSSTAGSHSKNKIAAGLFAIFLGGLGIHKFYLGYFGPGLVFVLVNTVGWAVTQFMWGLPNLALGVIAVAEGINYLSKSDGEFERTYVVGRRSWF